MENELKHTSYDEVPYESRPFVQTHPDRLATLGHLFGLSPVSITQSRVLEPGLRRRQEFDSHGMPTAGKPICGGGFF